MKKLIIATLIAIGALLVGMGGFKLQAKIEHDRVDHANWHKLLDSIAAQQKAAAGS